MKSWKNSSELPHLRLHQVEDSINQSINQTSLEDKVVEWEHLNSNTDKIMYEQNIILGTSWNT